MVKESPKNIGSGHSGKGDDSGATTDWTAATSPKTRSFLTATRHVIRRSAAWTARASRLSSFEFTAPTVIQLDRAARPHSSLCTFAVEPFASSHRSVQE